MQVSLGSSLLSPFLFFVFFLFGVVDEQQQQQQQHNNRNPAGAGVNKKQTKTKTNRHTGTNKNMRKQAKPDNGCPLLLPHFPSCTLSPHFCCTFSIALHLFSLLPSPSPSPSTPSTSVTPWKRYEYLEPNRTNRKPHGNESFFSLFAFHCPVVGSVRRAKKN